MTSISITPSLRRHLASGHGAGGEVVPLWDIPTLAGAGALRSTVPDLLRFAAANLDGDGGPLQRAMEDAHAPRHTIDPQVRIGLNWHIVRPFDRDIVWHNGGTGGFVSFLGLDKARRMAVVVLSNSTASSVDDIGLHLLDERVPLTPAPEVRREIALPLAAARPARRRLPVPARAGENHALAAGPRRPAARSRGGADLCGDRDGVLPEGHRCPDHVPARLARGGDRARAPSGRGGHPRHDDQMRRPAAGHHIFSMAERRSNPRVPDAASACGRRRTEGGRSSSRAAALLRSCRYPGELPRTVPISFSKRSLL